MHLRTDTSAQRHFSMVPTISRSRNAFSVSERHATTIQFDKLFPIHWKYMYPGDTLNVSCAVMARLATQVITLFDDLYLDVHAWFVPMRLIQTNWARYQFNAQSGGPSQDNSSLTSPKIDLSSLTSGFVAKTLYDYLGLPTATGSLAASTEHINNYLGRAYNLIYNENYRDENLQSPVTVDLDDGPDNPADYTIQYRGKRHDGFTSALTAAQKGATVYLPLGTSAPITSTGLLAIKPNGSASAAGNIIRTGTTANIGLLYNAADATAASTGMVYVSGLEANLAAAVGATLNNVRQSYAVQHLLEADARGGTRDVEAIANRWGVTVPDFRMQRPEYLGGSTFSFDGHIVPQTSASDPAGTPQANLAEFSQAISSMRITHSFVEHGVFMVLLSARSNITYQQGLPRELSHRTRYDWYQPEFANLGEVAMLNKEIYFQGSSTPDNATFGFNEYAYWMRYGLNRVSSEMRSNYATSLDSMHMAEDYSSLPTLSGAWIQSATPISRNIVVSAATADPIRLNCLMSGHLARTLPMYSIPGLKRL